MFESLLNSLTGLDDVPAHRHDGASLFAATRSGWPPCPGVQQIPNPAALRVSASSSGGAAVAEARIEFLRLPLSRVRVRAAGSPAVSGRLPLGPRRGDGERCNADGGSDEKEGGHGFNRAFPRCVLHRVNRNRLPNSTNPESPRRPLISTVEATADSGNPVMPMARLA